MPELCYWNSKNEVLMPASREEVLPGGGYQIAYCCGSRYVEKIDEDSSNPFLNKGVMMALSDKPIQEKATVDFTIDCVKVADFYVHLKLNKDISAVEEDDDN